MNNGINFAADGPIMDGTWQNMETGDVFEVRDSYIQDGMFMVQSKDGRIFDYNVLQNYVKVDKPIPVQPKKKNKPLPSAIASEIEPVNDIDLLPEDADLINGEKFRNDNPVIPVSTQQVVEDDDTKLINRVLARVKTVPEFDYKVSWKSFPVKQMEMLIDYMGVPVEKICNYYIDKMSIEDVRKTLSDMLVSHIEKQLDNSVDEVVEPKEPKTKNK